MVKRTILCVDDEKTILSSLKAQLKSEFGRDYNYETAESAEEALELLNDLNREGTGVAMIISDYLMPGMKGDAFLNKVHQEAPQIRKVLLTGEADENAVERLCDTADLFLCLRKPWEKEELVAAIRSE